MQYHKPDGDFFVGDCMPFWHDGVFHLFYLLDENHHRAKGGLGGHQWAHASTRDLVTWETHLLAIPLTEPWEDSICTGSVFYEDGVFRAFYAMRTEGVEKISVAESADCVGFHKTNGMLLSAPPGYNPKNYRDPVVFRSDDGYYNMLVTTSTSPGDPPLVRGALLHLRSKDLTDWKPTAPWVLSLGTPECPDYFFWNGWHYLIFSQSGSARYRMSGNPTGPWEKPADDVFEGGFSRVMKTARLGEDRRIGASFIPCREGDRDDGRPLYAGNLLLRELLQNPDGTLGVKFPEETLPLSKKTVLPGFAKLTPLVRGDSGSITLTAASSIEVAELSNVPLDMHMRCVVRPAAKNASFGLGLRGSGNYEKKCELAFEPASRSVRLGDETLRMVEGTDRDFRLDVVTKGDILDVCVDGRKCLLTRRPGLKGNKMFFFCEDGEVTFDNMKIRPF